MGCAVSHINIVIDIDIYLLNFNFIGDYVKEVLLVKKDQIDSKNSEKSETSWLAGQLQELSSSLTKVVTSSLGKQFFSKGKWKEWISRSTI